MATTAKNRAGSNNELVEYMAPLLGAANKKDVIVGVNGETIRIKRGVPVKIKRKFYKVLKQAAEQEYAAYLTMERVVGCFFFIPHRLYREARTAGSRGLKPRRGPRRPAAPPGPQDGLRSRRGLDAVAEGVQRDSRIKPRRSRRRRDTARRGMEGPFVLPALPRSFLRIGGALT